MKSIGLISSLRVAWSKAVGVLCDERMKAHIAAEATPEQAGKLWTATNVLMGLRYDARLTQQLLQGVRNMKESETYQAIVEEGRQEGRQEGLEIGMQMGRVEEARRILLQLGGRLLEPPSPDIQAILDSVTSLETMEALTNRLLDVETWIQLLGNIPSR